MTDEPATTPADDRHRALFEVATLIEQRDEARREADQGRAGRDLEQGALRLAIEKLARVEAAMDAWPDHDVASCQDFACKDCVVEACRFDITTALEDT